MPSKRKTFATLRLVVAAVGVIALIGDINFTIGTSPLAISNFFSYFTVQSMVFAVTVFTISGIAGIRGVHDTVRLDQWRALATTYITVSGIVFGVILVEGTSRGIPVWAPWSSQLLHFVIPAYALLDWWFAPGREVPWRTIPAALAFPAVWVVYTMIRGASVYWYPYFFLDPALVDIPVEFGLYLLAIVAIFSIVVAALIAISRRHHRRREERRVTRAATSLQVRPEPATGQGTAQGSTVPPPTVPGR